MVTDAFTFVAGFAAYFPESLEPAGRGPCEFRAQFASRFQPRNQLGPAKPLQNLAFTSVDESLTIDVPLKHASVDKPTW